MEFYFQNNSAKPRPDKIPSNILWHVSLISWEVERLTLEKHPINLRGERMIFSASLVELSNHWSQFMMVFEKSADSWTTFEEDERSNSKRNRWESWVEIGVGKALKMVFRLTLKEDIYYQVLYLNS